MSRVADHVSEIERAASGGSSSRDALVVESWRRCIDEHGLDPSRSNPALIVPDSQLREHREQSERLIRIARSGLENLFRQVAGQNYVLLLADRQGVTVDYFGDPAFEDELRRAGLYLGADWSEQLAGTCGVGSCIATGQAITVHQSDHFDVSHTPLSCTAAPIFDTRGELTAVLDISLLRSPQPKASQRLAMHLVTTSARRIELANLMATVREDWVLRLARSPEFLDVDPEAAIALDGAGRILGMTHGAAQYLARAADLREASPAALLGTPLSRYFDLTVDDLPNLTRGQPTEQRLVRMRDGAAIFCHAIAPTRRFADRRPRGATIPAPLRALCGDDAGMRALLARTAKLAASPLPMLIHGETGSGKERLARAIHESRAEPGPFVALNCAAIPENLIEGELFGHAAGAFSGALARGRGGLIEAADGGVLFLDEIGDMPLALQARLLRVLAEGEVTRLGEARPRPVRLKLISATNRDLGALVAAGDFREDLFYRIAAATLELPPLRARSDFEWLLERLLKQRSPDPEAPLRLSPAARLALIRRDWPGNIRELINVLDVGIALAEGGVVELEDLPAAPLAAATSRSAPQSTLSGPTADAIGALTAGGQAGHTAASQATPSAARAAQIAALRAALDASGGNISATARRLGVDRSTVHRRLRRYGLSASR